MLDIWGDVVEFSVELDVKSPPQVRPVDRANHNDGDRPTSNCCAVTLIYLYKNNISIIILHSTAACSVMSFTESVISLPGTLAMESWWLVQFHLYIKQFPHMTRQP